MQYSLYKRYVDQITGHCHQEVVDPSNGLPDGYRWVKWRVKKDFGGWNAYNVNAPMDTMVSAKSWKSAYELARKYSRYNWEVNVERDERRKEW